MNKYCVKGMSCAACQTRVEKAVSKVEGVDNVSVSLLTNTMQVEGEADVNKVIQAVVKAGYGATLLEQEKSSDNVNTIPNTEMNLNANYNIYFNDFEVQQNTEIKLLKQRFISSVVLLLPLIYITMGNVMWGWKLPEFFAGNPVAVGILQMLLAMSVMIINQKFYINGFNSVLHGTPNMDTLVAMGSGASFVYSVYVLFAMSAAQSAGDMELAYHYLHDLYFESAAMIVALITVGKMLESISKGKTTDALKSLMKLAPKNATIIVTDEDGNKIEQKVDISSVKKGDIFVVRPGDSIPVDGIVIEGISAIDESALTGESIPVDKEKGMQVSSGTINQSGFLKCEAIRVGDDTTLAKIIEMVSNASASKAPIAKIADKVSGVFVPTVIVISIITIIIWLVAGENVGFALARGISVLVISCPCALGLATPVAIMVGNGVGAKNGILFKNATAIENAGKTTVVALDKTGTITEGKPKVTDVITFGNYTDEEFLKLAYSLELKSEHPLAKAVVNYAISKEVTAVEIDDFENKVGSGVSGYLNGQRLCAGNYKYISSVANVEASVKNEVENWEKEGKTVLYFLKETEIIGIIAVSDVIKEDAYMAVNRLQNMGIEVVMLTGDNEKTALEIANQAGIKKYVSEVLPGDKEKEILKLEKIGKVTMVGDGINDAPALTRADIGMAIGAGTDIAIEAADVVLVKSKLSDVPAAIRLSNEVIRNIHQNLFWAFIYNIIGIPLAAGLWYPILGIKLSPMFGAAAMSLSSFCVVTNALRLNLIDIYNSKRDKLINNKVKKNKKELTKEKQKMEKIMKITGMMCGHCESRVKKVLEGLPEVDEAIVSHEKDEAIVKLNSDISDAKLKEIIEAEEYVVESIN